MVIIQRIFLLIAFMALTLLPACGSATPTLGVAGKPTLVFIYTDG
jgi:hypothetical protein